MTKTRKINECISTAFSRELIYRRHLSDVYSYHFCWGESVCMVWKTWSLLGKTCQSFFKALGISDTKESDIESRVHSTKFTMVALVWQQFVHHHCWWAIWPRGYHKPSVSVLLLVLQHWGSPQYWKYFYLFISGKRRFNTSVIVNATWVLAEFGFRSFWLLLYVLAAPIASFLVSLSF